MVVPVVSSYNRAGITSDLVLVHNHYNKAYYINFTKDIAKDIRISSINSSYGGGIVDNIYYSPMEPAPNTPNNHGTLSGFYSSLNSANYPFVEIKMLPNNYLVSSVRNTVEGITRKQEFKYNGLVVNLHGLGVIGFNKVARSNWYELNYTGTKLWSATENRFDLRGATERTYTSASGSQTFSFVASNLGVIPNAIHSTTNLYSAVTLFNIYKLQLNTQTVKDFLTNVSTETNYTYDSDGYLLPTVIATKNYTTNPSSPIGSTNVTTIFENNAAGLGANYYLGRPKEIKTVTSAYGNTYSTIEKLTYVGNKLVKKEKKGNTTDNKFLVEEFTYFPIGNIKNKKIYTTGYTEKKVIAPRITEYTYDATQRFIKTFKDIEGLISSNISYHPLYGEVTKSQNAFGLATSTFIDNWGKVYKITDYLGKHTNITYSKTGSDSQILKVGDDGSSSMSITDILGRTKKAGVLDIDNDWSYTTILYDVYGRKHQKSEPHDNLNNPSQWTTYSYDDFNRESSIINNTGLTTTITYSGLTVTATDGIQTTSSTKNANGHIISSSDNGGTITYQYFANGNLKNTNYNGTNILMEYDEWGRKSLLNDPSAGIYTYSYNPLGEILVETTPNGTTTSTYDSTGKLLIKHTEGLNTQDYITYSYDPISKLTNKIEKEDLSGSLTTNEYFYDAYNRLIKTNEAIYDEVALYEKKYIYDDFGRLLKEYSSASLNNKSSSKWIRNTYKRGVLWQIFDDATNHLLWQTNSVNQRGQLTNALLGNEIAIANTYDNYGYPTRIKHDLSTAPYNNVMTVNTTFEPQRGNLTHRDNNLFSWSENFSYDNLDRLTNFKDAQGIQVSQQYEIDGRISNNAMGTYNYSNSNKKYQNTSIDMNAKSKAYYENRTGLFNDDMESKNTWEIADPSAVTYDTTTPAHSGNTSLKIVNSSTHEKIVHSNYWVKIDNGTPTEYTYSAWVKSDGTNPQAEIFLFMKSENESGYFTLVDNKSISTSNNWVLIEKKFLVPAHIKNLSIRLDNNAIGNLWFDDVRIRKSFTPSSEKNLNISYNAFKSPIEIEETNVDKISFTYNINNSRSSSYYGGLQTDKYQRQYRKYYSADGAMEIKHNTHTNSIEFVTYIGGDGYTAPIILKSDGTTHQYNYLHRDHQGSILAITDQSGTIIEKRLFDAWGEIIKIQDGQHKILLNLSILDRGYTGHEHLESVGLINMNGRLYDSNLHRLLQPDNYVQDLNNTQNYNRYSYAFNNPLKYTDPDGENPLLAVAVGVFMGAATYTITAMFADIPFTVGGLFKASYIGAVSGAITFGIGEGVATIKPLVTRFSAQALAHGTSQGMISGVQGGDFWQGFASGSLSSIASGLYNGGDMANGDHWAGLGGKFAGSSVGILSFGSISGGAGAVLTGGNFWQGAAAGLTVSGLNHAMHSGFTKKYDLNVLADYEGAEGAGHQALAGELENKKLQYISKDGTYENAGIYGKSNYTDEVFNTINEINDYYGTYISPGKSYDVVATYRLTRSQMNTALTTARSYAHQTYNLFTNSCTTIVEKALYNAFKPQYTFFSPIPNITFQNQQFTYRDYLISVKNIN
ncbi:MAG TPA: RHS repeat-associated core domain-containing protein [Gelidibacter sp.]|uniref:RHS repeat-associated core domain-containing protein n=1 Tax=Gelidibacter sp. TaxID=2018083 RepID=UPI002BC2A636|nr:RHS repeat-associated core domain-containing protein [Gelidibacter sp.]HXJ97220.1 RHS repeat-associated core domain-containing protein [Gelidibacter sp.]